VNDRRLEARLDAMEKELQRLKDVEAIRRLENAYGYYLVNWMHRELIDLFSKSPETTLEWPEGTYLGHEGVKRFYGTVNRNENPEFLHQMMQISGIIDVDEYGSRARGRWWGFGALALPQGKKGVAQSFCCGLYENEFVKEDGVWKILKIKWVPVYSGIPAEGWVRPERAVSGGPYRQQELVIPEWWDSDMPAKGIRYMYPSGYVLPFHYVHPVTNEPSSEAARNARVKGVNEE
jgi:hypothetical protein